MMANISVLGSRVKVVVVKDHERQEHANEENVSRKIRQSLMLLLS